LSAALADSVLTGSAEKNLSQIRDWFRAPLGERLLQTEIAVHEQLLGHMFGYHLLQVSVQGTSLFDSSPIQNKISLGLDTADRSTLIARPTELPFEDDAADVVLVHHMLDFVESPQEMLRELSRVVLPMGYLIITGFNPFSLWGLSKSLMLGGKSAPWNGRFIRPGRLMDWMNLLNYKIDRAQFCTYSLPIASFQPEKPDYSQGLSRKVNLPFGAAYVIVARKHIGALTPIRPVWKQQQTFGRRLGAVRSINRDVYPQKD
jgi:SAM-dependent methyltransferase